MRVPEVQRSLRLMIISDDASRLASSVSAIAGVRWRSGSAEEFRHRLAEQAARLRAVAASCDEAAAVLRASALGDSALRASALRASVGE